MKAKTIISKNTGIPTEKIPSSYQIIGDIIILKFLKIKFFQQKKLISNELKKIHPQIKTICEIKRVYGKLRQPKIKKIIGKSTETIEKENRFKYKIDVSKIMFSKGNKFERHRIVDKIKSDEIVLDMFAGIGYFSIPIAKKCKKLIAIEKNKISFKYLKENIKLNNLKNVKTIFSDNRKIKLKEKVDRILMGYFPHTEKFLPIALNFIKQKGIIHFHNSYHKKFLWEKPIDDLKKYIKDFKILEKKKVKTCGPNTYHIVLDIEVKNIK